MGVISVLVFTTAHHIPISDIWFSFLVNVSVLGLADVPRGGWSLVAEFSGLILLLNAVYAAAFVFLERRFFQHAMDMPL